MSQADQNKTLPAARTQVRHILESTPAYRSLPPDQQKDMAHNMTKVASFIAGGNQGDNTPNTAVFTLVSGKSDSQPRFKKGAPSPTHTGATQMLQLENEVDFPAFVSGLIHGVFDAIVDASIQQMEAYGELLRHVAQSVDQFEQDNLEDTQDDSLDSSDDSDDEVKKKRFSARRRLSLNHQQALATQMMMGINRLVVTKGTIRASVSFDN
jgi:hypothetical protein